MATAGPFDQNPDSCQGFLENAWLGSAPPTLLHLRLITRTDGWPLRRQFRNASDCDGGWLSEIRASLHGSYDLAAFRGPD